jgi:hypothetical protein
MVSLGFDRRQLRALVTRLSRSTSMDTDIITVLEGFRNPQALNYTVSFQIGASDDPQSLIAAGFTDLEFEETEAGGGGKRLYVSTKVEAFDVYSASVTVQAPPTAAWLQEPEPMRGPASLACG